MKSDPKGRSDPVRRSEPGGLPEKGVIPLTVPEISGREWEYLKDCLDTGWVSSVGSYVDRFEESCAEACGVRRAVAAVNGTAALHAALMAAGIGPDEEVLVSALTFIAPANAVRYCGAWPVFIDAEPDFLQMDPERLEEFLKEGCRQEGGTTINKATGRRVTGIIPVHILGHPVDLDPVLNLASEFGLALIEDASEGLGGLYRGRPMGSMGRAGTLSFNGNKLITSGGGGMVLTDDEALAERVRYLTTQAKDDPKEYVHREIGYNYRLTNIQAALGLAQMERLAEYVAAKKRIARRYQEAFSGLPGIEPMARADWAGSTFWLYTVKLDGDSRPLMRYLEEQDIQTRPLWQPLNQSPAQAGSPGTDCPVAEELNRRCLSLPCSVGLSESDQDRVIRAVADFLGKESGLKEETD